MYNLAAKYIEKKITTPPNLGIILGSGLSEIADFVNNPIIIEYKNIPNFPISTVKGHKGRFVVGNLANREVIIMQGRFHYYEGYNPAQIALPV